MVAQEWRLWDQSPTDTVPPPEGLERLTTVSVAPLFEEAVRRINCGESVSGLFSDEDTYGE